MIELTSMNDTDGTNVKAGNKKEIIKRAILKSGFPLQMEISGILIERDYEVYNSVYFFDPDEKKPREFDIEAFMSPKRGKFDKLLDKEEWSFNPSILIECKKSQEFSWIFFDNKSLSRWVQIGHSVDRFTVSKGYIKSAYGQVASESFLKHYLYSKYVTGSYQQVRKDGSIEGKNEILDALSKAIKYMNYRFENLRRHFGEDSGRKDIIFYFPIVVFAGDLHFASFGNTLEIEEVPHLIYETRYLSNLTGELVPLYIDVVRKDALTELLSTIEKEVRVINRCLGKPEAQKMLNAIK
jgi:hypothetical protein